MVRAVAVVLVLLCATPSWGQTAPAKPQKQNPELYWSGVAVGAIGGAILGWGFGSPDKGIVCVGGYYTAACQETGVNKLAWIGTGAALMAGGWTMAAIGGKKVTIAPTRRGLKAFATWRF